MSFNFTQVDAALKAHKTIFFNADLQPVVPVVGDWFCEFDMVTPDEGEPEFRDAELVRYCGASECWLGLGKYEFKHRVLPDGDDCDRETRALFLIRQNY